MPLPPPRCAASVCLSLSPPQSLTAALPPLIARCQCVWLISPLVLSSLSLSRCLCSLSASLASPVLPSPWPACDSQMQRPLSLLARALALLLSCSPVSCALPWPVPFPPPLMLPRTYPHAPCLMRTRAGLCLFPGHTVANCCRRFSAVLAVFRHYCSYNRTRLSLCWRYLLPRNTAKSPTRANTALYPARSISARCPW